MKRTLSFLLALALLFSLSISVFAAEGDPTISIEASAATVHPGDSFTITWKLDKGREHVGNLQVDLPTPAAFTWQSGGMNGEINNRLDATSRGLLFVYDFAPSSSTSFPKGGTMCVSTFKVNEDAVPGDYTFTMKFVDSGVDDLSDNTPLTWNLGAPVTVTVAEKPAEGYSAGVSTADTAVTVGSKINVAVAVNGAGTGFENFAAAELSFSYDPALLSFDKAGSSLGSAAVKEGSGVIHLADHGIDKSFGESVYTLSFSAKSHGTAAVTLTGAAFGTSKNSETVDLIPAVISPAATSTVITKADHAVTLPDIYSGNTSVADGGSYSFTAADKEHYDYTAPTATMDGVSVPVTDNGDGSYTIANVTGDLVISGTRTAKTYTVTFSGPNPEKCDGAATAAYGQEYRFRLPPKEGSNVYELQSVTIGGKAYSNLKYLNGSGYYVIIGTDITGDIVVTYTRKTTPPPATNYTVTVTGEVSAAEGYKTSVQKGMNYDLTLKPEAGYVYTVTATMGGNPAVVEQNGNIYTVKSVSGNLVFNIEKALDPATLQVDQYLTLDGTVMWLVRYSPTLPEGRIPTYDGQNMFYSEKYNAYCYLVVTPSLGEEDAAAKLGTVSAAAKSVDYGMDVNMSGKVDANDAQLTYNMYNVCYKTLAELDKNEAVAMEKFLRADVNYDGKIDVADATAIITDVLAKK